MGASKTGKALSDIGGGLSGIGEGIASLFDPAKRAAIAAADAPKAPGFVSRAANLAGSVGKGAVGWTAWTVTRPIVWPLKAIGWGAAQPLKASASLGVGVVDGAAGVALQPIKWLANGVGGAFRSRPIVSLFVTAGAAAVAAGSWFASRDSKNLQAQSDAIQHIQMAQMQAMQEPQPRYMNNPEASQALVDARMAADRDNGVAGASSNRAEAVMAARQQAPMATADVSAI